MNINMNKITIKEYLKEELGFKFNKDGSLSKRIRGIDFELKSKYPSCYELEYKYSFQNNMAKDSFYLEEKQDLYDLRIAFQKVFESIKGIN